MGAIIPRVKLESAIAYTIMSIVTKRILADLPSVRAELATIRDTTYIVIPIRPLAELVAQYTGHRHQQNMWFILSHRDIDATIHRISIEIGKMREAPPPCIYDHWSDVIYGIRALAMDPSYCGNVPAVTCSDPLFDELIAIARTRPLNVTKVYDILYRLACAMWPNDA